MTATLERFIHQLVQSPLSRSSDLERIVNDAREIGQSPELLAHRLVSEGTLTRYQLEQIRRGRGSRLQYGSYLIQREIDRGGMGKVMLAMHQTLKRPAALKILPARSMLSEQKRERFVREISLLASLSHPNIVEIYDSDYEHGRLYFAMEYIEGQNLKRYVRQEGLMSPDRALGLILQAARGLACAHAAGIVHRDVKPSNLILDTSGRIKVLDLGLALVEQMDVEDEPLTKDGAALGTADFMAPEQSSDAHSADVRSDVYSLGATLYYLLTGRVMYKAKTTVQKLLAHRQQPVPDPAEKRPGLPPGIITLFQKMVAKSPDDRFQSMDALIRAIESMVGDESSGVRLDVVDSSAQVETLTDAPGTHEMHETSVDDSTHADLIAIDTDRSESLFKHRSRRRESSSPLLRIRRDLLVGVGAVVLIAALLPLFSTFGDGDEVSKVTLRFSATQAKGVVVFLDNKRVAALDADDRDYTVDVPANGQQHLLELRRGVAERFRVYFYLDQPKPIELVPRFE